ncbi:MAG: helix-turn-helix domain-containing protein [Caulobacteraceae bacterium]
MAIVKYERTAPYELNTDDRAALLRLTDEEIEAGADPENKPLTSNELFRLRVARLSRDVRAKTGLSQTKFAATYMIKPSRLRDLEQGRVEPDPVVVAYLSIIQDDPERARTILERAAPVSV